MPGKALKLLDAQKKVLLNSSTKMHEGSGWNPGSMGLVKVELAASELTARPSATATLVQPILECNRRA